MATECTELATSLQQLVFVNSSCADVVKINSSSRAIGDTVVFSCERKCEIVYATNVSVCQSNGTWTHTFPFCKAESNVESPSSESLGDGLARQDVIIISATVGAVAALVFLVILILLLWQKFCPRDPNPDERKRIINPYGSGRNSFLSGDFNPRQGYLYDNNFDAMEFKHSPILGPTRSRSFQDQRDIDSPYHPNGVYETNLQRTGSLDFGRMHHYDNNLPVERMSNFQTATLPNDRSYRVPRPTVGHRFEPLWNSGVHHM